MDKKSYDFSGWATRNGIRCSDGRVIVKDAFKHNDGQTVPLVWNHNHKDADNVLGHALLENRDEGVYAYCSFNETKQGLNAKELVSHGDICSLSIYANQLKQDGSDVIHGAIREVSLVLAGANPGAFIDTIIAHSDDSGEEARIYNTSETLEVYHSEEQETTEVKPEMEQQELNHADEKTVQDVFDEMTEEQKAVVYALIGQALEEKQNEGDEKMSHNLFEGENENNEQTLSHAELMEIIADGKKYGTLKDSFLAHSVTNIGNLFPEAQAVSKVPATIDRNQTWVGKVMGAVHHTPFSRVKSTAMDITADDARAKGYVKGNQKVQEVVAALKRTTDPQTVYKLQKLDRDDVIDITDFDIVAWIKQEMRGKLDEELARAYLIGDGRTNDSNDKIDPLKIRPILGDNSVYTIAKTMTRAADDDEYTFAKNFIKQVIKSRKEYKGSGNPSLYCTEDLLTDMLLIEDTNGRAIYDSVEKLATALRVKEIVSVPVMENVVRTEGGYDYELMGIIVNLADYNVGADKGGAVNMFDDFNIDYNKYEYLIETRCSGALVVPYSAITFEEKSVHEVVEG